jgi:hypothetical protein
MLGDEIVYTLRVALALIEQERQHYNRIRSDGAHGNGPAAPEETAGRLTTNTRIEETEEAA